MALQHDYRPVDLDSFFGNDHTIETIKKTILRQTPPKTMLITGPSGCGKTTLAYVIRDMLGCTKSGFHEFDASADRGIDKIRQIKEESRLLPMTGNIIVLFFDECHQITGPAQEAMLKLLEDPPPHVYLILATTEPHKLKDTVIRRCTQFTVDRLPREKMMELLEQICIAEKKTWHTKKLFSKINAVCWGSPGQAVKLLDQVIDMENEELAIKSVQNVTFDEATVLNLCQALSAKNLTGRQRWDKCRALLQNFNGNSENARLGVLNYLNSILLSTGSSIIAKAMTPFVDTVMYTGKAGLALAFWYSCRDIEEMENKLKNKK